MRQPTTRGSRMFRRAFLSGVVVTGAGLGASGVAAAATGAGSDAAANATAPSGSGANGANGANSRAGAPATGVPPGDPATMVHGPGETLLTGSDLQRATTAAEAAVPDATVVRAETDSSGASPYEVHLRKSDGSYVTVEIDSTFQVVRTIDGFGPGPAGAGTRPPAGSRRGAPTPGAAPAAA